MSPAELETAETEIANFLTAFYSIVYRGKFERLKVCLFVFELTGWWSISFCARGLVVRLLSLMFDLFALGATGEGGTAFLTRCGACMLFWTMKGRGGMWTS